jgi:phenylalanyl-tRNA synthetase beta chain
VEAEIRGVLTALGLDEAYTFSLVAEPLDEPLDVGEAQPSLRVDHGSRRRENALRQSLVPSLLAARAYNQAHGNADAAFFEIAGVYRPDPAGGLPDETTRVALVTGEGFAAAKGAVETLLRRLHVAAPLESAPAAPQILAEGRAAELRLGGRALGFVGEVDPAWLERLELQGPCAAAEVRLDALIELATLVPQHRPQPAHPAIARDLSLVVDRSVAWAELATVVRSAAGPALEGLDYLDTFTGGNLGPDEQSVHFGMRFRHAERMLTGEEVEVRIQDVVEACRTRLGARLRG